MKKHGLSSANKLPDGSYIQGTVTIERGVDRGGQDQAQRECFHLAHSLAEIIITIGTFAVYQAQISTDKIFVTKGHAYTTRERNE